VLGSGRATALALFGRGGRGELGLRGDTSATDASFWRVGVAGGVGSPDDESEVGARCSVTGGEGCERRGDASGVEATVGRGGRMSDWRGVDGVTGSSTTVSGDGADDRILRTPGDELGAVLVPDLVDASTRLRGVVGGLEVAAELQ
jgi:hypothetical protein